MGRQNFKPGNMLYPVPAVMVSCGREGEKPNIITVAWAGTICSAPPMLSISVRPERYSYEIIKDTKEFVVNLVTKDTVFAADYCGVKSGRDVDKFKEMKLTPLPSGSIKAPGIAECPVNLECRVVEVKPLGSHDLFLAEIVGVSVSDQYMDAKGKFDLNSTGLVAYSHGEYFELGKKLGSFGYSVKKTVSVKKTAPVKNAVSVKGTAADGRKPKSDSKVKHAAGEKNGSGNRKFGKTVQRKNESGRPHQEDRHSHLRRGGTYDKKDR